MCKQRIILEMIRSNAKDFGMSEFQVNLAEAQIEDYERMTKEIKDIKNDLSCVKDEQKTLKIKIESIDDKIDFLVENSKKTPLSNLALNLMQNKWFWVWILLFTALSFGANVSELATLLRG